MPFFTGWPVTEDELKEAALHSGVLSVEDDFLDATFRSKCEEITRGGYCHIWAI